MLKAGIVLVDPANAAVLRVIALQYNPETLTRSLQVQGVGADSGPHVDQLRLKGVAIETFKFDAEIDAADVLSDPGGNPTTVSNGIAPQLASLEMLIYPTTQQLAAADANARNGVLEIAPMDAPLALFVWSSNRIVPVRVTEFSITEEMFDSALNPIRAKVSLGLRVLSIDDLPYASSGGSIYLAYQQQKERLAQKAVGGSLAKLGITGIP
ncbi:hypothetical protein PTKU64_80340 [Paraburkholderia terrae]|uniref:Uncharacterized protein n=2 Tax=Paraburkholderia terrae TaxID=311230 RepID=A0ABN6JW32_9BURK|nr:hypothetical protein PTKU64_80340 [Paraburkholderia terrae]